MTSSELSQYISTRNGELSSDEILLVTDISRNPDINRIVYENHVYMIWDNNGTKMTFRKKWQ